MFSLNNRTLSLLMVLLNSLFVAAVRQNGGFMLYPSIGELIKGDGRCRYSLVTAVAKKTRFIAQNAEECDEKLEEKPITMAIRSFADGSSSFHEVVSSDDDIKPSER